MKTCDKCGGKLNVVTLHLSYESADEESDAGSWDVCRACKDELYDILDKKFGANLL